MRQITTIVTAVVASLMFSSAHAAPIVALWDLRGAPGNQAFSLGTGSANVTALNLARGPGLGTTGGTDALVSTGWDDSPNPTQNYYTFGFTVAPGWEVNLDTLVIHTRSSGSGPGELGLFYSVDGFANSLYTFTQPTGGAFLATVADLSSVTGLTGTVEFRIVATSDLRPGGGGSISSTHTFQVRTRELEGELFHFTGTTVPEPAGLSLLALGGFGLMARRRRLSNHCRGI